MPQSLSPRRLSIEELEERLTPTFGTPWIDPTHLTISFAPDGTNVTGQPSDLFALMNATAPQAQWQDAILAAYQTWADVSNVNFGLVTDGGEPLGVEGAPQGDVRFGDIRIAAIPLGAPGTPGATMADTVGFGYDDQTWSGDSVYNSLYQFGIGDIPGQQSDLYSVALHEAGHSLGLPDESTDPTSVMYAAYQGVYTGLAASDVAAIQALYGARPTDPYGSVSGFGTVANAYNLGATTDLTGNISQIGDVDVFQFTTPGGPGAATGLTVNLTAAGISLFTGKVTVLDAQGNVVASAVTTDPTNNNLSITIPNYQSSATYYVQVAGASTNVFSMGAYDLSLNYTGHQRGYSSSDFFYNNIDSTGTSNSRSVAMALNAIAPTQTNTYTLSGVVFNGSNVDWYQITPTLTTGTTGTLFVGTVSTSAGFLPAISIYDAQGDPLPDVVTMNQGGAYEVELANATSGTTYFIAVSSQDGSSAGLFRLNATLAAAAPTVFLPTVSDDLTTAVTTNQTQLTVTGDRLAEFSLSAVGGSAAGATTVQMSIYDSTGQLVFTLTTVAGEPMETGFIWLASGTYNVVFNAVMPNGSPAQSVSVALASRTLSDPIDPYPVSPTSPPPPPQVPITAPVPPPTTPPAPVASAPTSPPTASSS